MFNIAAFYVIIHFRNFLIYDIYVSWYELWNHWRLLRISFLFMLIHQVTESTLKGIEMFVLQKSIVSTPDCGVCRWCKSSTEKRQDSIDIDTALKKIKQGSYAKQNSRHACCLLSDKCWAVLILAKSHSRPISLLQPCHRLHTKEYDVNHRRPTLCRAISDVQCRQGCRCIRTLSNVWLRDSNLSKPDHSTCSHVCMQRPCIIGRQHHLIQTQWESAYGRCH